MALALFILIVPGLILYSGCPSTGLPVEAKAAIIDQLYILEPNQTFIDQATASLKKYGFTVDCYQGNEITVDFYRKLPALGYSLIIFRAHSGLLGSGDKAIPRTCLFSNEPYSETAHISEQLSDRLAKARIDENHPWVFGIGADFVKKSMQANFNHTAVIMMGCSTLFIDDLARSFIEKGASVYTGWNATVGLDYVDNTALVLLDKLLSYNVSIGSAVRETMQEKGADPTWGAELKYYPGPSDQKTLNSLLK
jgi:hypothetical protein